MSWKVGEPVTVRRRWSKRGIALTDLDGDAFTHGWVNDNGVVKYLQSDVTTLDVAYNEFPMVYESARGVFDYNLLVPGVCAGKELNFTARHEAHPRRLSEHHDVVVRTTDDLPTDVTQGMGGSDMGKGET